jgi:metal-responsive CopG/Arc/MetJ family transcriptional regulator
MSGRRIFTLSVPANILKEINEVAKEESVSKSELFRKAITDFIGRYRWERARKTGKKAARELKITEEDIEDIIHDFRRP